MSTLLSTVPSVLTVGIMLFTDGAVEAAAGLVGGANEADAAAGRTAGGICWAIAGAEIAAAAWLAGGAAGDLTGKGMTLDGAAVVGIGTEGLAVAAIPAAAGFAGAPFAAGLVSPDPNNQLKKPIERTTR